VIGSGDFVIAEQRNTDRGFTARQRVPCWREQRREPARTLAGKTLEPETIHWLKHPGVDWETLRHALQ